MQHRVETLHLAVHSPAGREAPAARLAERFTREVLEQFSHMVEARSPGRVLLVRRIALRWSVSEAEMADLANAGSYAVELADTVAAGGTGASRAANGVVAFDDEAGWLAAYLRERATGAVTAWFHETWREAERQGGTARSSLRRETVLVALSRLRATGELAGVVAALPAETMAAIAAALQPNIPAATVDARGEVSTPPWSAETTPAQQNFESAPLASTAAETPIDRRDPMTPGGARVLTPSMPDGEEVALIAAITRATQRIRGTALEPVAAAPPALPAAEEQTDPTTRFGGLFYLLSLALELGIGEALWKACLPEGLILAHAAAALLGPDAIGDPAPAAFGGVTARELTAWPTVSAAQQAETCIEILAATAAALPRHGAVAGLEVFLDLAPSPAGRMLVATGRFPFALFAWPAHDAHAAAAGVAAFLGAWPSSFPPPRAPKVLLNLDSSRRLHPASGSVRTAPKLPFAPDPPTTALLAQLYGVMAELFTARAGDELAVATNLVTRYLVIPGRLVLRPEGMSVVLPMAAIDLGVRRAALDRDAGWVPWLRRTVRFEFTPEGGGDVV